MTQLILSKIPKGKPNYIQIAVNLILDVELEFSAERSDRGTEKNKNK